jgi:ADP-ribose pyrophosphatase YjhB (NUDIX family)
MSGQSRRFARYRPSERDVQGRHFWAVPEGGLCLSAFLLLTRQGQPGRVLLGRPDPRAPWTSFATLEPAHVKIIGERWILPASHLLEFESPDRAAQRIVREQLELPAASLDGPAVFSEAYPSAIDPESGSHWDIHFVFRGERPDDEILSPTAWRELEYHDPNKLSHSEIARGHADILGLVGIGLRD